MAYASSLARACPLLVLVLCGVRLVAAQQEPVQLVVNEYDTVYLKNSNAQGMVGRVVDRTPDQGVVLVQFGTNAKVTIPGAQIERIERKQTAGEAVKGHGAQALAANDQSEVKKTIKWGFDHAAKDEAIALAKQALAKKPSADIAEAVVPMLIDASDFDTAIAMCRSVLVANPQWTAGYENLAKIHLAQKNEPELKALMALWIDKQPTSQAANRFLAQAAEAAGDLRMAQEAWRKPFELHHDYEAGLGYARTSLKRGARADALAAAETLIAANQFVDEAKAIKGSALLAQNQAEQAEPFLTQALAGNLSPDSAIIAKYNLGLIAFRAGKVDQARTWWTGLPTPTAELGLAMIERRAMRVKDLPPALAPIAAEYNACLDLQNRRFDQALAAIDPKSSRRQQFLAQVAAIRNPTEDVMRALSQTQTPESLRWQAFGHILARRFVPAEAALAQLPPNDGYAAVYRVYIAEALKDSASAKTLFAAVAGSDNPPREYVEILQREYAAAEDQSLRERFEGTSSDLLSRGWQFSTPGTNIAIRTADSSLVFEGTQTAAEDSVSRAWVEYPAASVRSVQATFDVSGLSSAICGFELLDGARANGIAYGILADNRLGWRELRAGAWGPWTELPWTATGNQVTLHLEQDRGRVSVVSMDDTTAREVLTSGLFKDQKQLCVSIFGSAEAGVAWKTAVKDLDIRLKTVANRRPKDK